MISINASSMSTEWWFSACIKVVKAVTKMIWKSDVPTTILVGIPSR